MLKTRVSKAFKAVAAMLLPAVLIVAAGLAAAPAAYAQLPFDPTLIDQLTPEQRQKALDVIGQGGKGGQPIAQPDGSFRDRRLTDPLNNGTSGGTNRFNSSSGNTNSLGSFLNTIQSGQPGNGPNGDTIQRRSPPRRDALFDQIIDTQGDDSDPEAFRIRPFGYQLFQNSATTFAPATDIPIPSDYVLGPGDSVHVQLFGNENGNYSLQVARDGQINFPKLGPISVAGQRFVDVKASLSARITRELIGVQSNISLGELRSVQIFLLGDVSQPGSYTVSSLATVTNALFVGGGISDVGSLRNVQLKRGGRLVRTLDLYALLLRGDSSADERLQPGDVIFVPPVGARVLVRGEVKRPAIYELKDEKSVGDVLALAGGLQASSNTGAAQLERFDGNKKKIQQIDVARAADLAFRVQDGDRLRITPVARRLDNYVRIVGNIKYPGLFQWSSGYELSALLRSAQVLPSDSDTESYLALGLVERTETQSGIRTWLSFNVKSVLNGESALPLERNDLIVILSRDDIAYLGSKEVRAVAAGDFSGLKRCPALEGVAQLINSERSIRFIKAFTAEDQRNNQNTLSDSSKPKTQTGFNPAGGSLGAFASQPPQDPPSTLNDGETIAGSLAAKSFTEDVSCPIVFRTAPRALQYLIEESVAVYGEVRRPGLYPIAPHTPLKLLIETAGGLSSESDNSKIEYISYRDALKNGNSEYQNIDLKKVGSDALEVNPGDVFNFKPLYIGQEIGTVKAIGEFRFPGSYGILRGERLSQLIKRAGGLTDNAYPYGAVFTRVSARIAEQESYRRAASDLQEAAVTALTSGALGKEGQISAQFLGAVAQRLEDATAVGRVVIETDPKALATHPDLDPILEPGDALVVPKQPISITVIGQVLNPGSLTYKPGTNLKEYVERAGGYTQAADGKRAFVILPNGTAEKIKTSFWTRDGGLKIPPGSVIVVPRDAAPFNGLAFAERIFAVLSNLSLTAAALATISRN